MELKAMERKTTGRNLAILGLLAAPWVGFLAVALKPNPRQMWAQRWPTVTFVGLYRLALHKCVEIHGLHHLPANGPVILAGNHINKTASDAMLIGSKILVERGGLVKFVSQSDPNGRTLKHFLRLMGSTEGVILPIRKGMTTKTMINFLQNPRAFGREQAILGIFPAGQADSDFNAHMNRKWHTSVVVAARETGAPIVPFYIEGLPYNWGPFDMLKAAMRSMTGNRAFKFKIELGAPILPASSETGRMDYVELTERLHQAVFQLAEQSKSRPASSLEPKS
jgi:1-acyl-sn-glycerol-3-phosphate acyltransferase